jgi:hypothetical protein
MISPTLVTLFGDGTNPEMRYGMEITSGEFMGGGLFDNIAHIFNQAKQAIGQIDIKTPGAAPGAPVAIAPNNIMTMLTNPIVIGGAALVGVLLVMKKKKR